MKLPILSRMPLSYLPRTIDTLEQAVRERTAMLEHEVQERRKAEMLQRVLFQIAELSLLADDIQKKFQRINEIIGQLIQVPNFMIAMFHDDLQEFSVEYFVDEFDKDLGNIRFPLGRGIASYVVKQRQAQLIQRPRLQELIDAGEIKMVGNFTVPYSWMGAPLLAEGVLQGVIIIQSYSEAVVYNDFDLELIGFVANQIAAFFARIRADEDIRNARLKLEQQNETLNQALHSLKTAQTELVEQEKLASLGRLVAGVAHEINTPLGICVTATSHMVEELSLVRKEFKENALDEESLEAFFATLEHSLRIMTTNSQRGAALVKSFKQVAVDQSSESMRDFDLRPYIDEILLSLQPKLKGKNFRITIEIPNGILMNTYAGAVSQVITNMLMNSLTHGFDGMTEGQITMQAHVDNATLHFLYADNGVGMEAEALEKLFEPFYTTKRGQGGSGLGAHIVYNLVTGPLGGSIKVSSTPGQGLQYSLRLPVQRAQKA